MSQGGIFQGELGSCAAGGTNGGEQVQKQGDHDKLVLDAIEPDSSLPIHRFTDGNLASRVTSWRGTPVAGSKSVPRGPRPLLAHSRKTLTQAHWPVADCRLLTITLTSLRESSIGPASDN
jgi:hypothetical protein